MTRRLTPASAREERAGAAESPGRAREGFALLAENAGVRRRTSAACGGSAKPGGRGPLVPAPGDPGGVRAPATREAHRGALAPRHRRLRVNGRSTPVPSAQLRAFSIAD